jgi:hypothetical protein
VAAELNVSQSLVYKWCQESQKPDAWLSSGASNPLDRVKKIYELTGDQDLILWICQLGKGYFVKNPNEPVNIDSCIMNNIHQLIKEFSETLDAISRSYGEEKRISCDEAQCIRKEWEDLKRIGESFVLACESGRFDKRRVKKHKEEQI